MKLYKVELGMKKKYLVNNLVLLLFLTVCDFFLQVFSKKTSVKTPRRILLSNLAHFGDVVLATAALQALHERYPESSIGFLVVSPCQVILEDHPLVDRVHTLDHWKLNRSDKSIFKKILTYYKQKRRVIQELKAQQYDVAIDLYPFFPNAALVLWQAKIPMRVGYESGGFGPLFTHSHRWKEQHVILAHLELLHCLDIKTPHQMPSPYLVRDASVPPMDKEYVVIHMGSGLRAKEWPLKKWAEVVSILSDHKVPIVFTGRGSREKENIHHFLPYGIDLSDRLEWKEFCGVIAEAKVLVGVDSVAAHVAGAYSVPALVIYTGPDALEIWKPSSLKVVFIQDSATTAVAKQILHYWHSKTPRRSDQIVL